MGQPIAHPTPPVAHALHDDDVDVVDGDIAKGVQDGLPVEATVELMPARWRVPLTWVHNPFDVFLLYRD